MVRLFVNDRKVERYTYWRYSICCVAENWFKNKLVFLYAGYL